MVDAGEVQNVFRTVIFSHPNTIVETTLVEHLLLKDKNVHHFDFTNLAQDTTIRVFEKSDGSTYRQISQRVFPTDYEVNTEVVFVILDGVGQDMKITLESAIAEGSAKDIPGSVRDETRQ